MDDGPQLPVVAEWFSVAWLTARTACVKEPHVDEFLRANIWYVRGRARDALVDAGNGIAPLGPVLARFAPGGRPREIVVVATHAHVDHIGGFHEFDRRILHPDEAQAAACPAGESPLLGATWAAQFERAAEEDSAGTQSPADFVFPEILIDALPSVDFDPARFRVEPITATHLVTGGDLIDLGDRRLRVLDLPGHTPGSIGLWDEEDAALYSGDAVYDGPLLDMLPESDVAKYSATMRWLRAAPVDIVYPGHERPFGRERLRELADGYLRRCGA